MYAEEWRHKTSNRLAKGKEMVALHSKAQAVLDGEIDGFVEAYLKSLKSKA